MARNGSATKERILDRAQELILDRGYGGMSLDMVIEKAGVTKGAFYYHFASKAELAQALVERFAAADEAHYWTTMERADRLSDDPLQQVLIAVGLMAEEVVATDDAPAGCLYASFCYQAGLFEPEVHEIVARAIRFWTTKLGERLARAMELHPPRQPVDAEQLADQFLTVFEGGFVMARSLDDPRQLERALLHYRRYLELLFDVTPKS
jgi:TetR/AcrR family transcriptional repressor of nem operon